MPYLCSIRRDKAKFYSGPSAKTQMQFLGGRAKSTLNAPQGFQLS